MPETISNTQTQQNTTSDDGRNVRPALICDSHFFIESIGSNTFQQDEDEKFGVVSDTVFRTTAKITFTGVKKIFAVCDGQVFIQPQIGNSEKINLILKPYKQPIKEIPIKYFIYRGLNKVDFITVSGENKLIAGNVSDGTQFVRYIHTEFRDFFQNANIPEPYPLFLAKMIGYSEEDDQQLTDTIDSYFFKITQQDEEDSNTAYEFPVIPKGIHLGNAQADFGIDIVLNNGDYYIENDPNPFQLNLKFARTVEGILDTELVSDSSQEIQSFKRKLLKENCTQFIDPAAFYGLHCNGFGKLTVTTDNGGTTTVLTDKIEIFNHFKYFHTKHTQYLYIQSNRQRSYNFYGNYKYSETNQNNIKIGTNETTLLETTFGTLGWPIHVIPNQDKIYLQLTTDNHPDASLFLKTGTLITIHDHNFVSLTNLLQESTGTESNPIDINFTKILGFSIPNVDAGAISDYTQIIYKGKKMIVEELLPSPQPEEEQLVPRQFSFKDIDDIFGLINAHSFLQTKTNIDEFSSTIDEQLQIINFQNSQRKNEIGVVRLKKTTDMISINDSESVRRVTYETLLNVIKNDNSQFIVSSSIDKSSTGTLSFSKQRNNYYTPTLPYFIRNRLFTDLGKTITGLQLKTVDGSIPTKKILGLSEIENIKICDFIETNSLCNVKLYLINKLSDENENFISSENIHYKAFSVALVFETLNGTLKFSCLTENIIVYTIDGFLYSSYEYGKWNPDNNIITESTNEEIIQTI